jgi:uncharacterized protein
MSDYNGKFVWYELMTTDPEGAQEFYRGVIGWSAQDAGTPGIDYTILSAGNVPVGGLMEIPAKARENGMPPRWIGYIAVDNVDDYSARVKKAGGLVHAGPENIPEVGRFCVVSDPQGAPFVLFKGMSDPPPQVPAPGTPGHIGWHELYASDGAQAFAFYEKLLGWKKAEAMDMGPMGLYQMFSTGAEPVGGVMTRTDPTQRPSWQFYINVDDIDAAAARVKSHHGQVMHGPQEVPGGIWIIQGLDPQGVRFALVGPRK